MGYREAITLREMKPRSDAAKQYREATVHRPSGWQYGQRVQPTVASQRSAVIAKRAEREAQQEASVARLSRRQKKRRRDLARRNAARNAEARALHDAIARLAETNAALRDYAASLEAQSRHSVEAQRARRDATH